MPPAHRLRRTIRTTAVLLCGAAPLLASGVAAAPAQASRSVVTTMADDAVLNGTHGDPAPIVAQWRDAGVRNVRLFAQWSHLAPEVGATRPPAGFGGTGDVPYELAALDRKIDLVRRNGMTVTLVVTGPGPVWGSLDPSRRNGRWRPSPARFGAFARAVARHVTGRVDDWIVWNEPNVATWLQPQNTCVRGRCAPASPHAYRKLAAAGYDAIRASDPTSPIAIGATSPKGDPVPRKINGTTPPLTFLRELSCVDDRYRRRSTGECRGFRAPRGNALAYHPHSNGFTPGYRSPRPADARMGDLSRLTSVVDRLTRTGRLKVVGAKRFPLWLTEYAYETNPPERGRGVSLAAQALWSQWGWWIAWNHPRVQMLAQYEWMDEGDVRRPVDPPGWQSGLHFFDGRPKPIAAAFPNPIFGYRTARAGTIWGQVRTATGATTVQLQRRSGTGWVPVRTVGTDARGAFLVRVPRRSRLTYRYTYLSPVDGTTRASTATKLRTVPAPTGR
ncbi:hypothetical protein [Patulibacter sp.]|uniref:hypothetical protein n=1 Tax=Patulibacter sp. TaxID=1912859 RepID=UPI00271EA371|nr:hypothetical protein [Patulibacter sp.]MDO9409800.1 hypothetical protein [Patulibacter sp.]